MSQADNLAALATNVNSSGVLQPASGGTGLTSPGSNGNVLTSNGTAWVSSAPATTSPAGSNNYVQYNSSGSFGASVNFQYSSPTLFLLTPTTGTQNLLNLYMTGARAANNQFGIVWTDSAGETNAALWARQAGSNNAADILFGTNAGTGGAGGISSTTERMRINSSGNVGIGTGSPQGRLDVVGMNRISSATPSFPSSGSGLEIYYDGTNDNGRLQSYDRTASSWKDFVAAANNLIFQTSGSERLRITSGGNVQLSSGGTSILNSSGRAILNQTGSILQVLSTTKTDTFTTTSTSFTDITGLSVTITPSSTSSRIAVFCDTTITAGGGPGGFYGVRLMRDATPINVGAAAGSRTRASYGSITQSDDNMTKTGAFNFVDSPATTSATTYKLQAFVYSGGTICINRQFTDSDSTGFGRFASTITVMEIAG